MYLVTSDNASHYRTVTEFEDKEEAIRHAAGLSFHNHVEVYRVSKLDLSKTKLKQYKEEIKEHVIRY